MTRLAAGTSAALLLLGAHAATQTSAHPPGFVDRIRSLEHLVIHGDMPRAREAATWVRDHVEPATVPADARPWLDTAKGRAAAIVIAADVGSATVPLADLVAACGSCHQAAGVHPAFPRATPAAFGSIAGHMVRHLDASDRLLEGLVVPSHSAWTTGAGQLRDAPLRPGDFPVSDRIGQLMADIETRLHDQAGTAMTASRTPDRAQAYATLLATCADCHTRHTSLWDQPSR